MAQLAILNLDFLPRAIQFNNKGIDFTINPTWASGGDEIGMKTALRKGTYQTLNIYFIRKLAMTPWETATSQPELRPDRRLISSTAARSTPTLCLAATKSVTIWDIRQPTRSVTGLGCTTPSRTAAISAATWWTIRPTRRASLRVARSVGTRALAGRVQTPLPTIWIIPWSEHSQSEALVVRHF